MFLIFLMLFSPIFYLYFQDSTLQLEGATVYTGRCVESNLQIHWRSNQHGHTLLKQLEDKYEYLMRQVKPFVNLESRLYQQKAGVQSIVPVGSFIANSILLFDRFSTQVLSPMLVG